MNSEFCNALKPAVLGGQRIPSIVIKMRPQTLAKTKRELLATLTGVLTSVSSDKTQLRSAPQRVQNSYAWEVSAVSRYKTAIEDARTEGQIRSATRLLLGNPAKVEPFVLYVLTRCEGAWS